jgi:hypothetical protein
MRTIEASRNYPFSPAIWACCVTRILPANRAFTERDQGQFGSWHVSRSGGIQPYSFNASVTAVFQESAVTFNGFVRVAIQCRWNLLLETLEERPGFELCEEVLYIRSSSQVRCNKRCDKNQQMSIDKSCANAATNCRIRVTSGNVPDQNAIHPQAPSVAPQFAHR